MKIQAYHWLTVASLLTLAHALYGWGSLSLVADIGPVAERSAKREGALTWTYMQGGRWCIMQAGLQDAARLHAEAVFEPGRDRMLANPAIAMDLLHGPHLTFSHRVLQWTHWGGPLLLLLTAIAYVRRQKPVVVTRKIR
jgi:hypothetical protein